MIKTILKTTLVIAAAFLLLAGAYLANMFWGEVAAPAGYVPFNLHFRFSSIFVMGAMLVFLAVLFATCPEKNCRTALITIGLLISNCVLPEAISFNSFMRIALKLNIVGTGSYLDIKFWWNGIGTFIRFVTLIAIIGYIVFGEVILNWQRYERNEKMIRAIKVISFIVAVCLLVLRAYTNPWYIVLTVITDAVAYWLATALYRFKRLAIEQERKNARRYLACFTLKDE